MCSTLLLVCSFNIYPFPLMLLIISHVFSLTYKSISVLAVLILMNSFLSFPLVFFLYHLQKSSNKILPYVVRGITIFSIFSFYYNHYFPDFINFFHCFFVCISLWSFYSYPAPYFKSFFFIILFFTHDSWIDCLISLHFIHTAYILIIFSFWLCFYLYYIYK